MKLRKSIWFILFLSVIGTSLNIGKAYGFSLSSASTSKDVIIKKARKKTVTTTLVSFLKKKTSTKVRMIQS